MTVTEVVYEQAGKYPFFILLSLLLIPINWALESLKWKFLAQKVEKVSFARAFRSTLTGLSLGVITPHGLGDYPGRLLHLSQSDRFKALGALFLSRIAQFFITLLFGTYAIVYFILFQGEAVHVLFYYLLGLLIISTILFVTALLSGKRIFDSIASVSALTKILRYFRILTTYTPKDFVIVFLLSFLRYLVFSFQFVLILYSFGVESSLILLFTGACFVFLSKSVIPTLFDLGVREASAAYFFGSFMIPGDKVILASLFLWFINIFIPALIGLIFIFKMKIFASDR